MRAKQLSMFEESAEEVEIESKPRKIVSRETILRVDGKKVVVRVRSSDVGFRASRLIRVVEKRRDLVHRWRTEKDNRLLIETQGAGLQKELKRLKSEFALDCRLWAEYEMTTTHFRRKWAGHYPHVVNTGCYTTPLNGKPEGYYQFELTE